MSLAGKSTISLGSITTEHGKIDSNRNLAKESQIESVRKRARLWKLMAIAACVVAVILAAILIWQTTVNQKASSTTTCSTELNDAAKNDTTSSSSTPPCPRVPTIRPLPTPMPIELENVFKELDTLFTKMVGKNTSLPAISANIFYQDTVLWTGHYGSKSLHLKNSTRPDDNTVYRIGSITKIFPVLLIYKLYENGVIQSVDDTLSKYIPEFNIRNPFTNENITLREIASQMSGLPREAPCIYHCEETSSSEQLALIKNRSLILAPWKMPSYSNLGYALLGRSITETLLNTTFEKWIQQEILDPLGMNNTGFEITPLVETNMAFPYGNNEQRMAFSKIGWAVPAGGMYSTIGDLTKLGMMFTQPNNQSIFKPSTVRQMSLPVDVAPDGSTLWGSPFEMFLSNGFLVRGKVGNIDSYDAYFSFVPQLELGINVMISTRTFDKTSGMSAFAIGRKAYDMILPALNRTLFNMDETAVFPISSKKFTGWYLINQTNMVTLTKTSYNASITESNGLLLFKGLSETAFPFAIKYIGDPLIFQAEFLSLGMSCFSIGAGIFADLHFYPPEDDGLSHGFTLPQWLIVGRRMKNG